MSSILQLSSQITFLYVDDLPEAIEFFDRVLGLEKVYDPGWSVVWRSGQQAFIGAVDASKGSIPVRERGGFLISLTVTNIEEVRAHLEQFGRFELTPIKMVKDIGLKSFFFKGPGGYDFEIQQFTDEALCRIF